MDNKKTIRELKAKHLARAQQHNQGKTGRIVKDESAETGYALRMVVDPNECANVDVFIHEDLPLSVLRNVMETTPGSELGFWAAEAGSCELSIAAEPENLLRMTGTAIWPVQHSCVRCLEPVLFTLPLRVDLRLFPGDDANLGTEMDFDPDGLKAHLKSTGETAGSAALYEDEDYVLFPESGIDILAILREQALLELPAHPGCSSPEADSPRVCINAELEAAKEAAKGRIDPRWDALRTLSEKMKN